MSDIQRHQSSERLSRLVVHNGTVYVAGVTATNREGDIQDQTRDVLEKIDGYLASVGSDKTRLLAVQIWLKNIDRDFAGMNSVWQSWISPAFTPTRATCEAKLASPELLVEIIVTAAL